MDFLLFVEEKLCLLLISTFSLCSILICYQANKSTFRTHFCCICSHVHTFHVAAFPFLGSQKFRVPKGELVEGRKGSNAQTQYCCSALWAMWLSGGLCVILVAIYHIRGQYITSGDVSVIFHLSDSPTTPIMDRDHFSQKCTLHKEEDIYLYKYKFIFYCISLCICIRRCYFVLGIWLASEHNSSLEMTLASEHSPNPSGANSTQPGEKQREQTTIMMLSFCKSTAFCGKNLLEFPLF